MRNAFLTTWYLLLLQRKGGKWDCFIVINYVFVDAIFYFNKYIFYLKSGRLRSPEGSSSKSFFLILTVCI